jgi:hypothetical protein
METTNRGYIYLLQLCDEKQEKVYKIGKSKQFDIRIKDYKFKNILLSIIIDDYENIEKYLISLIKYKYLIATGREYFYCNDEKELIDFILNNLEKKYTKESNEVILKQNIYNIKKMIENNFLELYSKKIEYLEKENKYKYNSMVLEMNNKIEEIQKISDKKYNSLMVEMNYKIDELKELEQMNNDKYNVINNFYEEHKIYSDNIGYLNFLIEKKNLIIDQLENKIYILESIIEKHIVAKNIISKLNLDEINNIFQNSMYFEKDINNDKYILKIKKENNDSIDNFIKSKTEEIKNNTTYDIELDNEIYNQICNNEYFLKIKKEINLNSDIINNTEENKNDITSDTKLDNKLDNKKYNYGF